MTSQTVHSKFEGAATAYLHSFRTKTPGSNDPDPEAIRAHQHPDCLTDFGHTYFVSTAPNLQGQKSGDAFITRLCGMASKMKTYTVDVTNTCVDVEQRTVVARAQLLMVPMHAEGVTQDILFWIVLDEDAEKVVRCTEFVDPAASAELMRRMQLPADA
ncbi:hypothetical protein LTR09_000729 [Extremus antarcticus]|uniref:SnoaL-like domain-containing protein n=1 Tax=Extremus antarcticus TaxID=702011 RepID=A0AAJ0GKB1_9PEZI|nr:hypothetical protein LTR09_000729 [Extremus antarcticus]